MNVSMLYRRTVEKKELVILPYGRCIPNFTQTQFFSDGKRNDVKLHCLFNGPIKTNDYNSVILQLITIFFCCTDQRDIF